jgi:hypothetical protein
MTLQYPNPNQYLQSLLTRYLPTNPVAPNTVAETPLNDDLPPVPFLGK